MRSIFDHVKQFEEGGEKMTRKSRYVLLMKVQDKTLCWESFNVIVIDHLFEKDISDFDALESND